MKEIIISKQESGYQIQFGYVHSVIWCDNIVEHEYSIDLYNNNKYYGYISKINIKIIKTNF